MTFETEKFEKLMDQWQAFSNELYAVLRGMHDATATMAKVGKAPQPAAEALKAVQEQLKDAKTNAYLSARVMSLESQLPEGMKHCTIVCKECEKGHTRLTATNWVQHGCKQCEIEALQAREETLKAAHVNAVLDCQALQAKIETHRNLEIAVRKALGDYNRPSISLDHIVGVLAKGIKDEIDMKCNYRKDLEAVEKERDGLLQKLTAIKASIVSVAAVLDHKQ